MIFNFHITTIVCIFGIFNSIEIGINLKSCSVVSLNVSQYLNNFACKNLKDILSLMDLPLLYHLCE